MSNESRSLPTAAPDRVLARIAGVLLATWLALALAGAAANDHVARRAATATDLALVAAGQRALVDRIADRLDALAAPTAPAAAKTARIALGWDIERLGALEQSRTGLEGQDNAAPRLAALLDDALRQTQDESEPQAAAALRDLFAARLAPQIERRANATEAAAVAAHDRARAAAAVVLGLNLLALAACLGAVALPAHRRISSWVHDRREAEEEIRFRLLHDPLTQMPNAAYLNAHLTRVAAEADRAARQTAVLRLDLDRFAALRDTLGPRAADEILRISARRIRQSLRSGDFAAFTGLGGFVLVASDLADPADAAAIAHRLHATLTKPFSLQGGARRIGCSIGVTLTGDDLPEPDRMLANAEIALAEAQSAGPSVVRYFREDLRVEAERRERLFAELVAGLERGELSPFFQPQIDVATGGFAGFEALVRWRHPTRGLLAPAAFMDYAEAADLTERIGEVVLSQSLAALTAWDAEGLVVPKVGVNFAMAQLRDPRLIERIKWEVERNDIDPARIAIEVLETVLIRSDEDLVVRNLRGLATAGFQIELDDFGTGHASIQNLRRLMVHRIKIDRSFILGLEDSEEQRTLTASMIAMASALGIHTLAEGVETAGAEAVLRDLGCGQAQGYLFARPMALADTHAWLRGFQPRDRVRQPAASPLAGDPNKP